MVKSEHVTRQTLYAAAKGPAGDTYLRVVEEADARAEETPDLPVPELLAALLGIGCLRLA